MLSRGGRACRYRCSLIGQSPWVTIIGHGIILVVTRRVREGGGGRGRDREHHTTSYGTGPRLLLATLPGERHAHKRDAVSYTPTSQRGTQQRVMCVCSSATKLEKRKKIYKKKLGSNLAMFPMACFCSRSPPLATPSCNATRRSSKPIPLWLMPTKICPCLKGERDGACG